MYKDVDFIKESFVKDRRVNCYSEQKDLDRIRTSFDERYFEGQDKNTRIGSTALDLISLTVGNVNPFEDSLLIRIPGSMQKQYLQSVAIKEPETGYFLKQIPFSHDGTYWFFRLPTRNWLATLRISSTENLRARVEGPQNIYFPLIFGQSAEQYQFVFSDVGQYRFIKAEIIQGEKQFERWSEQEWQEGEKIFNWTPTSLASKDIYEFSYTVETRRNFGEAATEPVSRSVKFVHDPDWLR